MLLYSNEKPIQQEKTKSQSPVVISCSFEVCTHVLNFIVIGQYMIDLSESNQSVYGFLSFTVKDLETWLMLIDSLFTFCKKFEEKMLGCEPCCSNATKLALVLLFLHLEFRIILELCLQLFLELLSSGNLGKSFALSS